MLNQELNNSWNKLQSNNITIEELNQVKLIGYLIVSLISALIVFCRVYIMLVSATILFISSQLAKLFKAVGNGLERIKEINNKIIDIVM